MHELIHAEWCKSSYSDGEGDCIEASDDIPGLVSIRDSKYPYSSRLHFPTTTWRAFTQALRSEALPRPGAEAPLTPVRG
ncbi:MULTISPECIES: DUF397 domain-containing protein [Streptomyces]|uniref:DUF397 domain-containing protein n=1 Tax=Streptomyces TaxID=1883 RepID=UPI00163CF929|nr:MULTISPECIES: DUF397 domain-containing protein [Streptomyces]MBC2877256.1 DUF397 domain-containing protein [Streptomyces sp. TYQ1024]UBI39522.1 DUF397 domain-containing protein [Streptomyces mobaraensis]UKW32101.1 DUF397 domain-containing protein [Streptomyces sp. TYQ1024]